jgi:hypothetical protein
MAAFVTGEIVPNPGGSAPFRVVFRQDDAVIAEWPVASEADGQAQIIQALRRLPDLASVEGDRE